jgi:hypothetical protein
VTLRGYLVRSVVPLLVTGFVVACGGKTVGENAEPGNDSGTGTTDSGAGCVDVEIVPSDLSCASDQDCTLALSGNICNGQCSCAGTPVNAAAAARLQSEIASLALHECPCPKSGEPRCVGGQCTLCGLGLNQPAGCGDSGTVTIEDGGIVTVDGGESDTGIADADGGMCVYIEPSTYDQSCNQASDCILIQTGEVCSGQCQCSGEPVNALEQSRPGFNTTSPTTALRSRPITSACS